MSFEPTHRYSIELPFPISVNRIWRASRSHSAARVMRSLEYRSWIIEADALWLTQKQRVRPVMLGAYRAHMIFSRARRVLQDGDNLIKCVNDWLQRAGIVEDDRFQEGGSWEWGDVDGCTVELEGVPYDEEAFSPIDDKRTASYRRQQPVRQSRGADWQRPP